MASDVKRKSVGGISGAVLRAAGGWGTAAFGGDGTCQAIFDPAAEAVEVPLVEYLSSFEEQLSAAGRPVAVTHTLRLVAEHRDAAPWLDPEFAKRCAYDGVVALVTLNDGRRLLCGTSEQMGDEQPLRLQSLVSSSGVRPSDAPLVELTLVAVDTSMSACVSNL